MYFLRGESTTRNIIAETTIAIWECLKEKYMPPPTKEKWKNVSQRYLDLWNIPNCLGAIDGKHFKIKCPPKTGSAFFNYKQYFSIVLMACVDTNGLFLTIDVGDYGRNSDGRVFRRSSLGKAIDNDLLDVPDPKPLPGWGSKGPFPHFFVADEAFPLKKT
ncbi:PREDICTED: uncharacterized protein LOC107171233 [Diuraphis noxia]|uniref:uncharacterized protein LOC107171233 n=1 Tax=Diuraphis noxia TaxID=143948 RepID=UPI0007638A34|nr:PREDICTED: uncharacterized protein LOC107171233 [Diuraphis noxia]